MHNGNIHNPNLTNNDNVNDVHDSFTLPDSCLFPQQADHNQTSVTSLDLAIRNFINNNGSSFDPINSQVRDSTRVLLIHIYYD